MSSSRIYFLVPRLFGLTAIILGAYFFISMEYIAGGSSGKAIPAEWKTHRHQTCRWSPGGPVVVHLRTKMGVNYDGGHWFHMAENFMAPYSALRAEHRSINASTVYFVFDDPTDGSLKEAHFMYASLEQLNLNLLLPGSTVYVHNPKHNNSEHHHQVLDLHSGVPTPTRFVLASNENIVLRTDTVCASYIGHIGGVWPTVQRGHWFPNEGDVTEFRRRITKLCPRNASEIRQYAKKAKYKLIMYQRDLSRKVLDDAAVLAELQRRLGSDWEIGMLMHIRDRSPCSMAHILHDTDVLITAHGFQSMVLLFLPRPALLFEVFPYRYQKRGYAPLSGEYGLIYGASMSVPVSDTRRWFLTLFTTEECMLSRHCRSYAREDDVKITAHSINRIEESISSYLLYRSGQCASVSRHGEHRHGKSSIVRKFKDSELYSQLANLDTSGAGGMVPSTGVIGALDRWHAHRGLVGKRGNLKCDSMY